MLRSMEWPFSRCPSTGSTADRLFLHRFMDDGADLAETILHRDGAVTLIVATPDIQDRRLHGEVGSWCLAQPDTASASGYDCHRGFHACIFFSSLEITRNVIAAMRSLLSQSRENIHPASLKHDHVRIIHDKENRDAFFLKLFSEIPLFYHPFPNVTEYLDCDFF